MIAIQRENNSETVVLNFTKSNHVEEKCPVCNKYLKYKPPCCTDKTKYLVCPCGFKKVKQ